MFGGFGSTVPAQSQAGTLFGASTTNNSPAGTLFGANTSNATSAAGTLFGGSAAATNTGFGGFNKPATTSAFGTATSQPAATGFGATPSAIGFGQTPGLGGFGAQQPATSTAAPTSSFSFGAQPATSTAGGFGAPATSTVSGFGAPTAGFGAQQPASSTPGSFTFGAQANNTPTVTTGFGTGAFGSAAGAGGFDSAAKPYFGSGFGAANTTSGFGATNTTGLFGNKPQIGGGFGQPQQQQQQMGAAAAAAPAPVQEKVWQDLALIRAHFDPTSPLCHFRHYFYNLVSPQELHLYSRPQNQDEQLWNEAVRRNPDPTTLVPVLAIGFDDILKRMEIQSKQLESHQDIIKRISERLNTVHRQYVLGTLVRLEEHKRRHADFTQRLLRVLKYSQVLRHKGFPLNTQEEQAFNTTNQLMTQNDNPENLQNKMLQLYNQLQNIKHQRAMDQQNSTEMWRSVRDEDTEVIAKVLEDEQRGIMHVANILKSDAKELDIIEVGLRDGVSSRSRMED